MCFFLILCSSCSRERDSDLGGNLATGGNVRGGVVALASEALELTAVSSAMLRHSTPRRYSRAGLGDDDPFRGDLAVLGLAVLAEEDGALLAENGALEEDVAVLSSASSSRVALSTLGAHCPINTHRTQSSRCCGRPGQ